MVNEPLLPGLLISFFILIVFMFIVIPILLAMFRDRSHSLLVGSLTGEPMCPKCCSSNDLEVTDYYAVKCKNCGFIFSSGRKTFCFSLGK
ncbi:MAG: hypothetical protein ACUVQY_05705 [Thermoproteota archaeon]